MLTKAERNKVVLAGTMLLCRVAKAQTEQELVAAGQAIQNLGLVILEETDISDLDDVLDSIR